MTSILVAFFNLTARDVRGASVLSVSASRPPDFLHMLLRPRISSASAWSTTSIRCCPGVRIMSPSSLKRVSSTDRDISPPPKRRATSTTTSNAVANFFKPASQKEPEKVAFHVVHDTLLVGRYDTPNLAAREKPVKIAAFDFDDTLITTKSGNTFARAQDDWRWWHATVPNRLKQLHADGYTVVVISNQAAVSLRADLKIPKTGMRSLNNFKGKVGAVLNALELPMTVYAATDHDRFRKPRTGMWEQMLKDYGLDPAGDVVPTNCVFVGDAAGREEDKTSGLRKDHSCSDRDLAANVGMTFYTPNEFFLGEAVKPFKRNFDPSNYLDTALIADIEVSPIVFSKRHDIEIVLFCGSPGAGKSTFFWQHMEPLGYDRVNQDILKSREKCMKVASQNVEDGKPVVVDNTNADIETRAAWISLARKLKAPIRLVWFTACAKLCEHNDTVRALTGDLVRASLMVRTW